MRRSAWASVLDAVTPAALAYLGSLPDRRVYPEGGYERVRAALDHGFPEIGTDPAEVVAQLARDLEPYVTAHASGRFFGFVISAAVSASPSSCAAPPTGAPDAPVCLTPSGQ